MVPLLTPVSGYYTTFYNHIAMVLTPLRDLGKTMAEPHSILQGEALAIEIELQNGDKVILATIYCPNENPSLRLFRTINTLSNQVIFLGDFNSKRK